MRTSCAPYMHQVLSEAEDVKRGVEDHGSQEWRAVLRVNTARAQLGAVLEKQVRPEHFDRQTRERFAVNYCLTAHKPACCCDFEAATFVSRFITW